MNIVLVDTNIILRFLFRDDEVLFASANTIFGNAESGKIKIYIDELVIAEVIWTLTSFYKQDKKEVFNLLSKLVSRKWIVNPRKKLILNSLRLCISTNLSYVDCWIAEVSKSNKLKLETFDKDLEKANLNC